MAGVLVVLMWLISVKTYIKIYVCFSQLDMLLCCLLYSFCVASRQCAVRSWRCSGRMKLTTTSGRWPFSARTVSIGSSPQSRRPRRSRASSTLTTQVLRSSLIRGAGSGSPWCLLEKWCELLSALLFCIDAFDNDLIVTTLWDIKEGKTVHIPVYDFVSHSRWVSANPVGCIPQAFSVLQAFWLYTHFLMPLPPRCFVAGVVFRFLQIYHHDITMIFL